jgi:hypothetical protein
MPIRPRRIRPEIALALVALLAGVVVVATPQRRARVVIAQVSAAPLRRPVDAYPTPPELRAIDLARQTTESALEKSVGCVQCHQGACDPHAKPTVRLGCVDCHGGDPTTADKRMAHVRPRHSDAWRSTGNPVRSYTLLNHEAPEFVRFVNPGDLRIAHLSCGTASCHPKEVLQVRKSMMTHGAMLWGAALYNNGSFPLKAARFGESYSMHGAPQRLQTVPPPNEFEMRYKGVLPFLDPLPRFEITQPGNVLRIFERGKAGPGEIGLPNPFEQNGRPNVGLSFRGLGTGNRTDPVFVGLQKTRLLDPTLNFLGTNDHPGDYRSGGCTACHVLYANDRSPINSGPFAGFGNLGMTATTDPTIPKNERGHPIAHRFTTGIPTSQCLVCHIHPGTNVLNSYAGFMWWDEETDGELLYPAREKHPDAEEVVRASMSNPDEAAVQGLWSDPRFLERVADLNANARHTQFADFHGHGWVFRAVFKKDREGNLLDREGNVIADIDTAKLVRAMALPAAAKERYRASNAARVVELDRQFAESALGIPVHQMDIHLEKGMHCVDCHFVQDVHGNTKLYQEVRAAIEIQCIDCHGTVGRRANLRTTGPASDTSGPKGRDLSILRTPFGRRRFESRGGSLYQNSMVEPDLSWEVVQTADTIDPTSPHYNERARLAKTVRFGSDGRFAWGDLPPGGEGQCAHANGTMSCVACHSAWNPSCFGCHLPQKAMRKAPELHNAGDVSRNYVSYNFQTLRDDVYMLAKDGDVTGNRIGPARSSCAVHVGSYNINRESVYVQQQTISAEGMSGIAFSTNVPHTVRGRGETKLCTDCHVSTREDNNAIMAQLLMQGTGYTNFIGRYCWVAAGDEGLAAVAVSERDEPQAVIGSYLHRLAFPDRYRKHVEVQKGQLEHAHEHFGPDIGETLSLRYRRPEIHSIQARGEFLYAACGENGLRVYDIANIDHKGFSERIVTAPVSPMGQRLFVRTAYATAVAAPTTIAPDPTRTHRDTNHEAAVHAMYGYIYLADKFEGLILVPAATLLDGNPTNNFLGREVTFNPGGILAGASALAIVGRYAYLGCNAGLVVVDLDDPKHPQVVSVVGPEYARGVRAIQAQFRYAFLCDCDGVKVLDITDPARPRPVSALAIHDAHSIYVARTYAYVAGGKEGLIILDVKNPLQPRVDQVFNAGGRINDLHDVKLGITYVSEFAYLADGENGLRVVQLTSPETPGNYGFSPRPTPCLIASYKIPRGGRALSISRGLDRDRAVDEAGRQIGVFGRIGARPLNLREQQKLYLRPDSSVWRVSDDPRDAIYGFARDRAPLLIPVGRPADAGK